jgi:hypothetical protein
MSTLQLTPAQLRDRGYAALLRELGPVDFVRFLKQFEPGQGDYSHHRHQWLDRMAPDEISQVLDQKRRRAGE